MDEEETRRLERNDSGIEREREVTVDRGGTGMTLDIYYYGFYNENFLLL